MEIEGDDQPPQDIVAEQALVGAALLSPGSLTELVDAVRVDDFYRPAHATIWAACLDMFTGGEPVDAVTVAARLAVTGELLRVGGAPYLHTLISTVPTAANAGYYAEIVRRKSAQRRAVELGERIALMARSWPDDDDALVDRIEAETAALAGRYGTAGGVVGLDAAVDEAFERLAGPVPPTVSTGLVDLDEILAGGMVPGDAYVIAARPGLGKSLVGANIAVNVAKSGRGVLVCSLEMRAAQITDRVLANEAGVELTALKRHRLNDFDWQLLRRARDRVRGVPLQILDTPDLTMAQARRHGERLARRPAGLGLIVIDYVQLMPAVDPRVPRQEQVAELSRGGKRLADHLGCPVILISQTNRRDGERDIPTMGDLRESGALEADASAVMILRRPAEPERVGELDLHVVKNRHGREGVVTFAYSPCYSRVRSLAREMREAA